MYAYIRGTLAHGAGGIAVVEAGGVGYQIFTSDSTILKLPSIGSEVKLYTHLNVREDAMELFGFLTSEELTMYELLISVSGVGPRVGLAILSTVEPSKFALAVITSDIKTITKAPGVGPKLAQRIVLELKDKLKKGAAEIEESAAQLAESDDTLAGDAVAALTVLGYTPQEAAQAVAGLTGTLEEVVGAALKNLMRGR